MTAYKTLMQLKAEGKIKGIGVSNYAWEDYLELKQDDSIDDKDLPLVNQIEINPFLYRKHTISYQIPKRWCCVTVIYRSLRDGKAFDDPTLLAMVQHFT